MPDPMTQRLSESVARLIRASGLSPAPSAVAFRKRPTLLDGDTLPLVIVTVGDEETFEPLHVVTGGRLRWAIQRPVAVVLAMAATGKAADNADLRNWRDTLWSTITQRALARDGVTEANDVSPRGRPIFDPRAFDGTTADWSTIDLTVETLEDRGA